MVAVCVMLYVPICGKKIGKMVWNWTVTVAVTRASVAHEGLHDTVGPETTVRLVTPRTSLMRATPVLTGSLAAGVTTATRAPSLTAFWARFAVSQARLS